MVGLFEKHEILFMLFWGWVAYLFHVLVYILCIAHPFCVCVCGDDRITCYSGADDLTGGSGDA